MVEEQGIHLFWCSVCFSLLRLHLIDKTTTYFALHQVMSPWLRRAATLLALSFLDLLTLLARLNDCTPIARRRAPDWIPGLHTCPTLTLQLNTRPIAHLHCLLARLIGHPTGYLTGHLTMDTDKVRIPRLQGGGNFRTWQEDLSRVMKAKQLWRVVNGDCPRPTEPKKTDFKSSDMKAYIESCDKYDK